MSDERDETQKEETPPAEWEKREEFRVVKEMKVVVGKSIEATEMELSALRRKLERLQYGS